MLQHIDMFVDSSFTSVVAFAPVCVVARSQDSSRRSGSAPGQSIHSRERDSSPQPTEDPTHVVGQGPNCATTPGQKKGASFSLARKLSLDRPSRVSETKCLVCRVVTSCLRLQRDAFTPEQVLSECAMCVKMSSLSFRIRAKIREVRTQVSQTLQGGHHKAYSKGSGRDKNTCRARNS